MQVTLFGCSPPYVWLAAVVVEFVWCKDWPRRFGAASCQSDLSEKSVYVSIGDFALIGNEVVLYNLGKIEIGANAVVSQRSYLCAAGQDYIQPDFPIIDQKVCVGAQSW
jgi:acetyltransferase-like isoleucine patch superfamily enzyme